MLLKLKMMLLEIRSPSVYYQQLFNSKENSLKKLWSNLNTICSYKKKTENINISKIKVNNKEIADPCNMSGIQ